LFTRTLIGLFGGKKFIPRGVQHFKQRIWIQDFPQIVHTDGSVKVGQQQVQRSAFDIPGFVVISLPEDKTELLNPNTTHCSGIVSDLANLIHLPPLLFFGLE
jgi:hypothetical protein